MFISKDEKESLQEDNRKLYNKVYELETLIWQIARACGLDWQPPESGKWIKK